MFKALYELKSNIIVDKLLETTSTANYSKSTHIIKNAHIQKHVFTIIIISRYNSTGSLPVQSVACQSLIPILALDNDFHFCLRSLNQGM